MFTMVAIVATRVEGGRRARSYAERVRRIGGGGRARPRALSMHFSHLARSRRRSRTLHYHTLLHTREDTGHRGYTRAVRTAVTYLINY